MANLLNDRNELLYSASTRVTGASVVISSGVVNSLIVPRNATVTTPSAVTLQANTTGYVAPSYAWSYRFGDTGNFTSIAGTTNTITFACDAAFLTAAGTGTAVQFKVVVAETTSTIGINQSEYTLNIPIIREGAIGTNGINSIMVILYKRTATNAAPALTTQDLAANSTYTFGTGQIIGQPTGWSQSIPASSGGAYLWTIQILAASTTASYSFSNTLWPTAVLYSQDGNSGTNTALIYAYKRSATAPTDNPGVVDYSFSNNSISTASLANSWSKTIPTGTDPLYVTVATAASTTATDNVLAAEWTTPAQLVKNGTDGTNGINTAILYLYARNNNSTTAPTLATTGTATYTFTTGAISGTLPTGWTTTIPAESNGTVIWVVQATAAANTTTDDIANTEWGTPRVLALQGVNGTPGTRGSRTLYSSNAAYTSTYTNATNAAGAVSYAVAATTLIAGATTGTTPTTPIKGDTVTFSNPTAGSEYVYTITHDGTNWVAPGTIIDGSLLVTNSVTAAKINSNGLSIKDASGNIILSAGVNLDFSKVGGDTKPANNANNTYIDSSGNIQGISSGGGTTVDNSQVKVGGVNFFLNSSRFTNTSNWNSNGAVVALDISTKYAGYNTIKLSGPVNGAQHNSIMRLKADTLYTVSALVKGSDNTLTGSYDTNLHIQCWRDEDLSNAHQDTGITGDYSITTSWKVIYQTFKTPVSATAVYCRFFFYPLAANFTLNIAYTKLEEGNKATDWSPNPEEVRNTNITISNGSISGIGAGAGTLVDNASITIANGALNGIGTGAGTAVANSLIETLSVTPTGGMAVAGNTFTKTSGTADWNAQVYSTDSYVGGAYVKFSALQTTASLMVGLNTDPTTDASYGSIDYCIYLAGSEVYIYESGTGINMSTGYTVNDVFAVTYDGSNIKYYKNGSVLRTVQVSITSPLYLDSSFVDLNAGVKKVSFGPMSSNAWSAITGQPSGIYNSNISVSNGAINGIGTGAGTVVDNTFASITQNLIFNSDQTSAISFTRGWTPNGTTFDSDLGYASRYWGTDSYTLAGNTTRNLSVHQNNNNGSGSTGVAADFYPLSGCDTSHAIPVIAGKKYIFSCYLQGHRCGGSVGLIFWNSAGTNLGESNSGYELLPQGGAARLEQYSRRFIVVTAPAGASCAAPYVRKHNTIDGSTESYFWMAAPQFECVNTNVSTPGTYVAGPPSSTGQLGYTGDLNATYGANWASNVTGAAAVNAAIAAAALAASNAAAAVGDKLNASSASTLSATISVNAVTGAGFRSGDLTWNASGVRTAGKGVAMTPGGLVGHNGTNTTFAINASTGDASFNGSLDITGTNTGSGYMTMNNNVIKIFDGSGTLRVKIGDLS